jgi:hypothetical protein
MDVPGDRPRPLDLLSAASHASGDEDLPFADFAVADGNSWRGENGIDLDDFPRMNEVEKLEP